MKQGLLILFLFALNAACAAQDTVITISPAMFNPINEIITGDMDGWEFKKQGDSVWVKLKPADLSADMADKNKRLEGWLRFRFKLSSEFGNTALDIKYYAWAAAEIYLDGKLLKSFGTIGTDAASFHEYNPSNKLGIPVNMTTGDEHEISVRFADYISPFSSKEIKSVTSGLFRLVRITGPEYKTRFAKYIREWPIYATIWIVTFTILTLLFWLLAFLNKKEKNLVLFASCVTLLMLTFCLKVISEDATIGFKGYMISLNASGLLATFSSCLTLVIVAMVFKNKVTGWLKIIIASLFLIGLVNLFTKGMLQAWEALTPVFVYLWYIISSRRTLKGAKWAIVIGLLLFSFIFFLYIAMVIKYKTDFIPYNILFVSGIALSFPLSLLVYIAMRFKEIVTEVRQHAAQVMKLSEEKKEQALKQQKVLEEEVALQTLELRTSFENLKSAQQQLIQSEKMASLGELTAGIAHEIQNPLNFVNNFSEVSNELIAEMNDELNKGDINEAKVIANDIKQNLEKINHHGKRADAIVKGMLQHSRSSSGQKELTDINALSDEYLRLAYHGLRAKDKSFNATMKTDFDETIGNINIIPQDIGRVILNLINNAFYVVDEKKKSGVEGYEPTVSVSTKKTNGKIEIKVADNGNGIPKSIVDKIFQPFFTTKPTGQGTGLGLSLAYDIVKAHEGELKLETKEGAGTTFIILLPVNNNQ